MHLLSPLRLLTAAGLVALSGATASAETSISLDIGFGIRYVPPAQVTVPEGEYLRISAPEIGIAENTPTPVQWTKDGQPISGAKAATLVFDSVTASDAGVYVANYDQGRSSQSLILGVGPTQRLVNLSTRAQVGAGENTFIGGFVVTGAQTKKVILRAIGPTLSQFGVKHPVAQPVISIFDQNGKPYENGYVYPAVIGGPTYESDLAESLRKAGALPLPEGSKDAVEMRPFLPGSYTVHVTSADGSPGVVLLEIFEVP